MCQPTSSSDNYFPILRLRQIIRFYFYLYIYMYVERLRVFFIHFSFVTRNFRKNFSVKSINKRTNDKCILCVLHITVPRRVLNNVLVRHSLTDNFSFLNTFRLKSYKLVKILRAFTISSNSVFS